MMQGYIILNLTFTKTVALDSDSFLGTSVTLQDEVPQLHWIRS